MNGPIQGWRRIFSLLLTAGLSGLSGCQLVSRTVTRIRDRELPPPAPVTYSQYHLNSFSWDSVTRVLVLPVLNESEHTKAGHEFQAALASELQRMGRFEVISAPEDDQALLTRSIHRGGRFDEATLLEIGRQTRAEVVVHATVTQYSPYPRPRIGLVVQAVAPLEGKAIASVDGLWDTTDAGIAEELRTFYRQRPRPKPAWIRNHQIASDDAFASELALDSPQLFQRWVSSIVSNRLVNGDSDRMAAEALMQAGQNANCSPPRKHIYVEWK